MVLGPDGEREPQKLGPDFESPIIAIIIIRAIRGYRTIVHEAVLIVAGSSSWNLLAGVYRVTHERRVRLRQEGGAVNAPGSR